MEPLTFSESEIQCLFGHEAAEDETPTRLKEYYFKTSTYEQVVSDMPLRILVGHKGIGKSALFQVSMLEDTEQDRLPILIEPDDVTELGTDSSDFLKTIREWKNGLLEIIASKVLRSIGIGDKDLKSIFNKHGGNIIEFLIDTLKNHSPTNYTPTRKIIIEKFLSKRKIFVYIDDLDRGWKGREIDIHRISALLNAIRDIIRDNTGIFFKIGLRSDVYYLVRTSDESTDKIEGSVTWLTLTNHEIFVILIKRIETFFNRVIDEQKLIKTPQKQLAAYLYPIMEDRFSGRGHWENAPMHRVIMSLIRKRPRDMVKLCSLAARNARECGFHRITTQNFKDVFEEYSQGRLTDTENEFESELKNISRLLLNMKPNRKERTTKQGFHYKTDKLLEKIKNIQELGELKFTNGHIATAQDLAAFMYKINFLTARKETPRGIVRKYFEENRYLSSKFSDFGFDWEVHPAYRWALQPDSIFDIYNTMELSRDDK
ncbi:MAG: hypothetical protein H8E46_04805 [FCB group bacterium]|nr:hypothetical protein [FCB group bacterium]